MIGKGSGGFVSQVHTSRIRISGIHDISSWNRPDALLLPPPAYSTTPRLATRSSVKPSMLCTSKVLALGFGLVPAAVSGWPPPARVTSISPSTQPGGGGGGGCCWIALYRRPSFTYLCLSHTHFISLSLSLSLPLSHTPFHLPLRLALSLSLSLNKLSLSRPPLPISFPPSFYPSPPSLPPYY